MTEQFKDFSSKEEENLEEKLKGRYMIERLKEGEWAQCESDECFEEAEWFVEGSTYCQKHKMNVLKILEKSDEEQRKKQEEEKKRKEGLPKFQLRDPFEEGNPELREKFDRKREEIQKRREEEKQLTEEEREMKSLLSEEYKNRKTSLFDEGRRWQASHPDATLGDSIRALYKEIEEEPKKNTGPQDITEEGGDKTLQKKQEKDKK